MFDIRCELRIDCDRFEQHTNEQRAAGESAVSYYGDTYAQCRAQARRDGWKLNMQTGGAVCAKCIDHEYAIARSSQ